MEIDIQKGLLAGRAVYRKTIGPKERLRYYYSTKPPRFDSLTPFDSFIVLAPGGDVE